MAEGPPYVGPNVTISGTPAAAYNLLIMITLGGSVGTATFKWSTNNGSSWTTGATTGSAVSLGPTGLVVNFAAGTYVINTLCASPTFGWSSAVGTSIVDGGVTWLVMDGGAALDTINGGSVSARNVSIFGCTSGIIVDGTESAKFDNIYAQAPTSGGFAAFWLAQSLTTQSQHYGTLGGVGTNAVFADSLNIYGYPYAIADDGGQLRSFRNANAELSSKGMLFAGAATVYLDTIDLSDGAGTTQLGGAQAQSPNIPAANTGGRYFGAGGSRVVMKSVGFGSITGQAAINVNPGLPSRADYSVLTIEGVLFGGATGPAITGGANLDHFADHGGSTTNYSTNVAMIDAMPASSTFQGQWTYGATYKGFGVNTLPPSVGSGLATAGLRQTAVTDVASSVSTYTCDSGTFPDYVIAVHPHIGGSAITIPAPAAGRHLIVMDEDGTSAANPITLTPTSGTVAGASTFVLQTNNGAVHLVGNAAGTEWDIISQPKALLSRSAAVDVSSGATPAASVYNCDIIQVTGTQTGNQSLTLPSIPGRIWYLDLSGWTGGGHNLFVFTGSNGITLAASVMQAGQLGAIVACVAANTPVRMA